MALRDDIERAVVRAVTEAENEAVDEWRRSPALNRTASLTGAELTGSGTVYEAHLTFETHAQNIPAHRRDPYGVAKKAHAAHPLATTRPAGVPALMREMEHVLEDACTASLEACLK